MEEALTGGSAQSLGELGRELAGRPLVAAVDLDERTVGRDDGCAKRMVDRPVHSLVEESVRVRRRAYLVRRSGQERPVFWDLAVLVARRLARIFREDRGGI